MTRCVTPYKNQFLLELELFLTAWYLNGSWLFLFVKSNDTNKIERIFMVEYAIVAILYGLGRQETCI